MKTFFENISPSIIKNKQGEEIGVFFEIQDYNLLMEQVEDLFLGKIAQKIKEEDEETKSLEDFEKELN